MPIHNLGYREWNGELESSSTRWTVVAEIGVRRAWQSMWLRRMLLFAWLPAIFMGFMIFLFEQAEQNRDGEAVGAILAMADVMMPRFSDPGHLSVKLRQLFSEGGSPEERRHTFWSILLLNLFRRSQPFILIPIVGVIAPTLISQDFRSRAFLLYFSRPLTRVQYILGKAVTILFFQSLITLFPALLLFTLGVLLSPSFSVLTVTWDLPLRIFLVSAVISIPTTCLALMLSSLTTDSRYASFGWFAIWIFGYIAWTAVVPFSTAGDSSILQCLSLFHLLSDVAAWVLDQNLGIVGIDTRLSVLAGLTAISLIVVFRRVSAPMQI